MTNERAPVTIRTATTADLTAIRSIYNEGILDRLATLDADVKSEADIGEWYRAHDDRYGVLVAERSGGVAGWASLNPYSHRCAYRSVAELSVYVRRQARGTGVGTALLRAIELLAKRRQFHKIVLFALSKNLAGQALYAKVGYRDVGTFREQGYLDGRYVDVIAMERLLKPFVLFVCRHNTGRSQMAEAYLRHFAGDAVETASAGTIAATVPDPGVVLAMAEDGVDIASARPKLLEAAVMERADRIITMGCDVAGVARPDEDWGLPDPKAQPPERVREIRDLVRDKVARLAASLAVTQ